MRKPSGTLVEIVNIGGKKNLNRNAPRRPFIILAAMLAATAQLGPAIPASAASSSLPAASSVGADAVLTRVQPATESTPEGSSATGPDTTGPVLVSSTVTPQSFNLAEGPATVEVTVRLTDETGVKAPTVLVGHDRTGQSLGFGSLSLISGTATDGTWQRTMTIPQATATGPWSVKLYPLSDSLDNSSGGFQTLATLQTANVPATDTVGPVLVSRSVTPKSFDLDEGPATIEVTVRLTDRTGVTAPTVVAANEQTGQTRGLGPMSLISGTTTDGTWHRSIIIPQESNAGVWNVTLYPLDDSLGNRSYGYQILATPYTLNVDGPDTTGPVVVSSSVTPRSFNLAEGPATVKVTARLNDQTKVVAPTVVLAHDGTDQSLGFGTMSLVSGTTKDGTWERTMTIPQGSATGLWKVTLYPLSDSRGNSSAGFPSLATINVVTSTAVTPAPVIFTDKDGTANDTYTIPATTGVDYIIGGKTIAAGTYPGAGTLTVTAKSRTDYVIASGAIATWTSTFKTTLLPVVPGAGSQIAVKPFRALDTRASKPAAADGTVSFQVGGINGIPKNVSAVVFNLTVTEAKSYGFVTAHASGTRRPDASNINYGAGQTRANLVTVPVGADGRVTLFNRSDGTAQLIADVAGYYVSGKATAPGAFQPVAPSRFLDTRSTKRTGADGAVSFQVGGVNGIPKNVSAVVFNLTVTEAKSFGFVTAHASGTTRPDASNLNYETGQTRANLVTVPVGADGKVTLFNRSGGTAQLIADVAGYYISGQATAPGAFQPVAPSRFLDTRSTKRATADGSVSFQVGGIDGIPKNVSAVVFNLTVTEAKSSGFVTAHASGTTRPDASNINYGAGQTLANLVSVPVGADGKVTLFNRSNGTAQLIADVAGYYIAGQ